MGKTRLKSLLESRGVSQKELSQNSDVQEYKISLLCNGKSNNIHLVTAKKICEFLNCSLDDAFGDILNVDLHS
jgi:DNA-binding Xre family transcriptional regulator